SWPGSGSDPSRHATSAPFPISATRSEASRSGGTAGRRPWVRITSTCSRRSSASATTTTPAWSPGASPSRTTWMPKASRTEMIGVSTPAPKLWELRAAVRAGRSEGGGRDFALDIVNAAWSLVERDEILDFTVRQVIERAGVALKTFYRYFGNKDELL